MEIFRIKLSNLQESDKYLDFSVIAITEGYIDRGSYKIYFSEEVLDKYAKDLKGKPVLLDHIQDVSNVIGVVKDSYYDRELKGIIAQLRISKIGNEKIVNLLQLDPRPITDVSIGALITKEKIQENIYQINKIEFKEISIVFEGADKNAKIILKEDKMDIENLTKENVRLSKELENVKLQLEVTKKELEEFKELANIGKKYKEHLEKEAIKFVKLVEGEQSPLLNLLEKADISTLKDIVESYKLKAQKEYTPSSVKTNEDEPLTQEKLSKMSYKELLALKSKF
ncbi:MAG: HK97 family phage prohead protease [Candidatus Dojkabacteria bacterium]|nr:HK97 family phage prohead protease [Candidatus Dojkabacteria bacterium]